MGRSGYVEDWDCDSNFIFLTDSILERSCKGKRGREFLETVAREMDAMPKKVLIAGELIDEAGDCCTMGVACKARSLDVTKIDYTNADDVAKALNIAPTLAREVAFQNDDDFNYKSSETPEQRWVRMRKWVDEKLKEDSP